MTRLGPLASLLLLLVMPVLLALNALSLALVDLAWKLFGRRRPSDSGVPARGGDGGFQNAQSGTRNPKSAIRNPVSVVIPTWNGRDLLEKYLPSVVAAAAFHPDNEILVVDNASEDSTAEFVRERFPSEKTNVRLLLLEKNLGFGGGNNAGVAAARHDIVVVLNNDMRVEPDTFVRLLEGFQGLPVAVPPCGSASPGPGQHGPASRAGASLDVPGAAAGGNGVFAVSAQIFFSDPERRREETGLTEGDFRSGFFHVGHVAEEVPGLYPAFYAGGGSSAFDRRKFLELGGFDPLFHPFYMEDTDLSYLAWKRGWQVLYQPAAVVRHEHRGTIGRRFSAGEIDAVLKKNHVLMVWKNVHDWGRLWQHFLFLFAHALVSFLSGTPASGAPGTRVTVGGYLGALGGWPAALRARWRARSLAVVDDQEALERSRAGYFRDRFLPHRPADPARPLDILFVSPYSLYPPTHGGGVFMYQAVRALARRHRVHVLALVDREEELETNRHLEQFAASVECVWRRFPARRDFLGLEPHAVRCFSSDDFRRRIERALFRHDVDILQLEYTQLGQYGGGLRRTPSVLFEHDVYFQSVRRRLVRPASAGEFAETLVEWLRALRYELRMLRRMDVVQTTSSEERRLLESLLGRRTPAGPSWRGSRWMAPASPPWRGSRWMGRPAIVAGSRTALEVSAYRPVFTGRQPWTALFVGNFQHAPNRDALRFLVREVWPRLLAQRPRTAPSSSAERALDSPPEPELVVVGAEAGPDVEELARGPGLHFLGRVEDIREPLSRYSVFLCPIFAGAGVRVKILEAFACGIPVVSTPLGSEGLDAADGRDLLLARNAREFVSATLEIFEDPERAEQMARRARQALEKRWDWEVVAPRLEECYRTALARCRPAVSEASSPVHSQSPVAR